MFDEIKGSTKILVSQIKRTQEYNDYQNYRSIIERQEELFRRVQEFRRKSFEIQTNHQYGMYNAYESLIQLKNEHEELLSEPTVKMFLDAELRLSKMLAEVYDTLAEELDFDTKFLD